MADIALDQVWKRFGSVDVIRDVSLRISIGRTGGVSRPVRFRKDDAASDDRRT